MLIRLFGNQPKIKIGGVKLLSKIWMLFLVTSVLFGVITHRMESVTAAVTAGAEETVTLMLHLIGVMSLWSGMMELVSKSGLSNKIASLLRPALQKLFKEASNDNDAMEKVSANITANLLGLSNAATPIGLQAAERLHSLQKRTNHTDAVKMLILLNTTSIQIIPTTVAAIRAGYGAANPYDIMPAIWGASFASVAGVVFLAVLLRRYEQHFDTG